jgi:hypothetical protein
MIMAPKSGRPPTDAEIDLRVYLSAFFYVRFLHRADMADIAEIGVAAGLGPDALIESLNRLRTDGFLGFEFDEKTNNLRDLTFLKAKGGVL